MKKSFIFNKAVAGLLTITLASAAVAQVPTGLARDADARNIDSGSVRQALSAQLGTVTAIAHGYTTDKAGEQASAVGKGTATGAIIGAGAGAAIGSAKSGKDAGKGALWGAAAGGIGGYIKDSISKAKATKPAALELVTVTLDGGTTISVAQGPSGIHVGSRVQLVGAGAQMSILLVEESVALTPSNNYTTMQPAVTRQTEDPEVAEARRNAELLEAKLASARTAKAERDAKLKAIEEQKARAAAAEAELAHLGAS